jgi:hypothetical protein
VLAVLHFAIGTPLAWAGIALALYVGIIFLITLLLARFGSTGKANSAGTGVDGKASVRHSSSWRGRQ